MLFAGVVMAQCVNTAAPTPRPRVTMITTALLVPTSKSTSTRIPFTDTPAADATSSANCPTRRSSGGSSWTAITFVNSTGRAVKVYWVDYRGFEQFWFEMQPGQSVEQKTYVSNVWCVRDKASNATLFSVVATQDHLLASIAAPSSTLSVLATASPRSVEANTITPAAALVPRPTPRVLLWEESTPIPKPSAAPFDTRRGQELIFHTGRVYVFGGRSAGAGLLTEVYYSAINPDGTLAGWIETTSLPGKYYDHVVVGSGNYVYLLTGAAGSDEVYYAPFNADGSIGLWKSTASLSPSRQTFAAISHGGFIYATGGNSGGVQDFVQYASVNSDGSLTPWEYTTPLPSGIQEHTMAAYDGYLYVLGGRKATGGWLTTVYFSAINPDGTLAGWKTTSSLPLELSGFSAFEANGYIYLLGGPSTYYASILENHALGLWQTSTPLPSIAHGLRAGAYNGFVYAIGGYYRYEYQNTVYYSWIGPFPSVADLVVEHPDCTSGWTRLAAGDQAKVSAANTTPNRVRTGPSTAESSITLLYPGSVVKLLEGPICADGVVFWKVKSQLIPGGVGWTAEGDGEDYFLEPYVP